MFEITSSIVAGSLAGYSYYQKSGGGRNDHSKIVNIARNCGLKNKEGKEIRIHRKSKKNGYTEFVYQMPQGLSAKDFQDKLDNFQDGLNIKKTIPDISINDFKSINWKGDVLQQIKEVFAKKQIVRKEVEITFDGMLKFRVYDTPMTDLFPFVETLLRRTKDWEVVIGTTRDKKIKHDFDEIFNMVIAGSPGYGKTVLQKLITTSLILKHPDHVSFTLIDLKGGLAFSRFSKLKQVESLATDTVSALEKLQLVEERMEKTLDYLRENEFEDVKEAGMKDRHFIIIDEAADLSNHQDALDIIERICAKGRGAGYRVIYCTQYPINKTIPSSVRQNCDGRVCFKLQTSTASLAALDEGGAEDLPFVRGRAIYKSPHGKMIIQTPMITNDYIKEVTYPHINIRPRKENDHTDEKDAEKGTARGSYTLVIEETELS
ncbi:FtsK/SpoIIIE domain-containing protein [Sutcliffiella horikoshii]|uniref:Cell division protein FtsK n=1 Tax=Sutcliffiella horikoshii TaxID=79883 RepID=A0A5D4TG02_9BACI|nr:FtsK/SpoIIIE domain-containing protein [Sutcliffiella horikoshii]TYS74537.1 cell division protein FtsK [Sutcliffiella horikoshii]